MSPPPSEIAARWRIGITQREQPATAGREASDALDSGCIRWLSRLLPNAIAIPIPNFDSSAQAVAFVQELQINALVFSGGGDLHAQQRRLSIEQALLHAARHHRWPVIGICRGMQAMQHLHGGEVIATDGHVGSAHELLAPSDRQHGGVAASLNITVNSWHHFGIRYAATGWRALACSADHHVEAMRHDDLPWLGLMWHPERENGGEAICDVWIADLFKQLNHQHSAYDN